MITPSIAEMFFWFDKDLLSTDAVKEKKYCSFLRHSCHARYLRSFYITMKYNFRHIFVEVLFYVTVNCRQIPVSIPFFDFIFFSHNNLKIKALVKHKAQANKYQICSSKAPRSHMFFLNLVYKNWISRGHLH